MNKAKDSLEALVERFHADLVERGVIKEGEKFRKVKSSYGVSHYLYIHDEKLAAPLKVRISDHSVLNIDRILSEFHIFKKLYYTQLNEIERAVFPERYKEVMTPYWTKPFEIPISQLRGTQNIDYKIHHAWISKKGTAMAVATVRKHQTHFIRIQQ